MRRAYTVMGVVLLASFALVFYFTYDRARQQKEEDFRQKLPFESLVERLPKGKPIAPTRGLNADAKERWQQLDRSFAATQDMRISALKALHERTHKFFVESPDNGSGRRFFTEEELLLASWSADPDKLRQPGYGAYFPSSPDERVQPITPSSELQEHHELGLSLFLDPINFGYLKNRAEVAGFKAHGFRYAMRVDDTHSWRVEHILLVGILTQPTPVVYLTDRLPSMEQVRRDKTRPLDLFEEAALQALRQGEDLYVLSKDETLRMLGAVRATKTCQQCHDAEIGDLLGAFSYTLRPGPKARAEKRS